MITARLVSGQPELITQPSSKLQPLRSCVGISCAAAKGAGQIHFQEVTDSAGISYIGPSYGASWGDFNGDGRPDLWVGNHDRQPSLYLNQGDGTFIDIASQVWSADPDDDTHGAAWADFDNDGDQDLLEVVGAQHGQGAGANHFFVNSDGMLVDQAAEYGLDFPLGRGRTPLWVDWSGDGQLDVLLANEARADGQAPSTMFQQITGGFQEANVGIEVSEGDEFGQLADLSGDSRLDLILDGRKYPQRVYDMGTIPFEDLTTTLGLLETENVRDVIIADFDGDLHSDLLLIRSQQGSDFVQIDDHTIQAYFVLEQGERGVSFKTVGEVFFYPFSWGRVEQSQIFIGADGVHPTDSSFTLSPQDPEVIGIKDHIPDTDPGIYIGYNPASTVWQLLASFPGNYLDISAIISSTAPISNSTAIGFDPSLGPLHDRLLIYNSGVFEDQTVVAGLDVLTECISGAAGDFDNDMDVDVYLVCNRQSANLPNILYENQNNGDFVAVPEAGGAAGSFLGKGESVAIADYDGDGFLDLFVTNGEGSPPSNGPHQLFRNLGNDNHWLEIDLVGVISNRDGIGARILATAGGITQLREQGGGMHRFTQNHQRIHFGLGSNSQVDCLVIYWPSGIVQEINNIAADHLLRIVELPILYLPIVLK